MAPSFVDRLQHSWNAFTGASTEKYLNQNLGVSYSSRPDVRRFTRGNKQSIVSSVYNQIAVDCAAIPIYHCRVDEDDKFLEVIKSGLTEVMTVEANLDQTGRSFIQDVVTSMIDEGVVAVLPTETNISPLTNGSYDITQMRTAKIIQWYPKHVKLDYYDENTGRHQRVIMPKNRVAIIENPLYSIMNEPNSILQRLIRKMNLLDAIDEQSGSGKLDLIIQLPYSVKTEARRKEAEERRKSIEQQLANNKFGVAYADATEHIIQLNRSVENNLSKQVEYLTDMLYSQLGLTKNVFNGTANEQEMLNYYSRTVEPIMSSIADEFKRKFLTKTARTQGQSIKFFRNPFRIVPVEKIADIADKLTRNAIMTSNEFRGIIGYKPSEQPIADDLSNKNMPGSEQVSSDASVGFDPTRYFGLPMSTIREAVNNPEQDETFDEGENQNG